MMFLRFGLILSIVIATISSSPLTNVQSKQLKNLNLNINQLSNGTDLCKPCIEEVVSIVNTVANLILDEGIFATCSDICDALSNVTGSELVGEICKGVCDAVGMDEFIHLIMKTDIDPIYYCEFLTLCKVNDNGDGKFVNFGVFPKRAPMGAEFVIDCSFISVNGTGTGSFSVNIVDPENRPFGSVYLFEARKPGRYPERIGLPTLVARNCDPSKEVCAAWVVGTYNVSAQLCNGLCGSHHPHTSTYDFARTSFEITKKTTSFP